MDSLPLAPSAPPETPDEKIRRLTAELHEAHEQQAATTEILKIINSSPGDLTPVFETMLESAMRLCEAACGHLATFDGQLFHTQALQGDRRLVEWLRELGPFQPGEGNPSAQLAVAALCPMTSTPSGRRFPTAMSRYIMDYRPGRNSHVA
jgi:hypothetical protein